MCGGLQGLWTWGIPVAGKTYNFSVFLLWFLYTVPEKGRSLGPQVGLSFEGLGFRV